MAQTPTRRFRTGFYVLTSIFASILAVCSKRPAFGGDGQRVISAEKAAMAPRIDAVMDEPIWETAEAAGGFTQKDPDEGKPATLETTFRIAYDRSNLYLFAHMIDDDPKRIAGRLTRRDRDSESDWFGIVIDSYHDHKSGRFFFINAAGVQRDGSISNDSAMDDSWDGVWELAVRVTGDGWDVELRVPFSALRFASLDSATWGFNALRYISRKKEEAYWAPIPRSSSRFISLNGHLTGISTLEAPRRLALVPYQSTTGQLNTDAQSVSTQGLLGASSANAAGDIRYGVVGNVGIDVEYGLTSDATLNLSVNPDFGQVEVDQAVVNLTAFETFFPEKRPFFREGADIFQTVGPFGDDPSNGTRIFYSRRIGGQPLHFGDIGAPDGRSILENPNHTPILSAAKVTGRSPRGLSVGVLEAVTGETYARVQNADGSIEDVQTASITSYGVARVRQDLGEQSYVGGMVTAVNRAGGEPDAYVAAADSVLRTRDGRYSLNALLGLSGREGESDVQVGSVGQVIASKEAGDRLVGAVGYTFATPGFDVNDLGYMKRVNEHSGFLWVQLRKLDGLGPLRQARMNYNAWNGYLMKEGLVSQRGGNINVNANFRNYWSAWAGVGGNAEAYDAYEPRVEGRVFRTPAKVFGFGGIQSDSRKPVTVGLGMDGGRDVTGAVGVTLSPSLEVKLGSRAELSLGSNLSVTRGELAWAATVPGAKGKADVDPDISVFGRRDIQQADVWARGTMTFTDRLSVQFFSQLLVAQGLYGDYQQLMPDGSLGVLGFDFDPSSDAYAGYDPDFNARLFNANVILRWEYRPGSTLFAVWTQSRAVGGTPTAESPAHDLTSTFTNGSENALMLKLNYRWGT